MLARNVFASAVRSSGLVCSMQKSKFARHSQDTVLFPMWCMVCSPLLIGTDVRTLDNYSMETLTNPEIIAISQDLWGNQAQTVGIGAQDNGVLQVYAKAMSDGSFAVALLNRGSQTAEMSVSPARDLTVAWGSYMVRDVWDHATHGPFEKSSYTVEVISHEARILRLWEVKPNATMALPRRGF